ncbi:RidA family protein [Bacteroidota bacterium]
MIEEKIREMGFDISSGPAPLANYVPAVQDGKLIFTAGQIPLVEGKMKYAGKVGKDLSEEEGMKAAELCALNGLKVIKSLVEDLDQVDRILKLTVFVNSADGFTGQAKVANGASDFLVKIFGDNGKHVRSTVGVNELPLEAAVEIDFVVKVK